jgi:hypothetical protein
LTPNEKIRRLIVTFVHMVLDEPHGRALGLDLEALWPAHLKIIVIGRDCFDHGLRRILDETIRNGGVPRGGCQAVVVRDARRRELDSPLVQPRWPRELA